MIVLLNCSISLFAKSDVNAFNSSTGEVVNRNDSVLVSYDDLRLANSKLIQLDYEKKVNTKLRSIITNDSITLQNYKNINNRISNDCRKAIHQRNIIFGVATLFFITTIILLVK